MAIVNEINISEPKIDKLKIIVVADDSIKDCLFKEVLSNLLHNDSNEDIIKDGIIKFGDKIDDLPYEIWYTNNNQKLIGNEDLFYSKAHAIIGIFNTKNRESFENIPFWVGEMIKYGKKMLPLVLIAIKENINEGDDHVSEQDILEYAYEIGDCAACKVPVIEYVKDSLVKQIEDKNVDPIKFIYDIVTCTKVHKCFRIPTQLRNLCDLKQFYKV